MAARFNTQFAFKFAVISMIVVVILGGLGFLAYRANTQRHITAGDELMAQGEYIDALNEYGRALNKDRSNLSYLAKYEEALLKIHPATPSQALEYYAKYLGVFNHKIRYEPTSSDRHLEYLKELYSRARLMESPRYWGDLYDAASAMKVSVPQSDPKHVYADLYLGLSITRKSPLPTREELQASGEYLTTFLKAVPDSDKGWAGRVQILLSEAYRERDEGNTVIAEGLIKEADDCIKLAQDAVAERPEISPGPEVAKLYAARLIQLKADGDNNATDEKITQAIDEMIDWATDSSDPLHLLDISNAIRNMDRVKGVDRGIEILQQYIKDKPFTYLHRFMLADLLFLADKYDESNELSNQIIDAQPVAVGLLSRHLLMLQIRSASLVVDCEFKRWEKGDEQEKISRLLTMKQARLRLAELVPDPDTLPLLLRADGKIAYAQGNYHAAAEKFEKCLGFLSFNDYEVLLYSAQVLELIGQEGAAIDRLNTAMDLRPGNLYLLRKKAGLQLKLMRISDASETINQALSRYPDDELVLQLAKSIDDARLHSIGIDTDDILIAVEEARQAIDAGEYDSARITLLNALDENGDDVRLLYVLAVIELRAEKLELAREYLDRAIKIQPDNQSLRILKSTIGVDDPLERFKLALKISYPTEPQQTVRLAVELLRRADRLSELAEKSKEDGNDEEAVYLQEQADRTRSEGQLALTHANELDPDHRVILEYLLTQSLVKEDWESAEKIIERAKTTNADQAQGLLFRGRYELSRELFEQAVQTLTSATELKPYESHAWRLLGRAYESLGNYRQAQRTYSEAYERDPNDLIVVQWYVSLLERIGKNTSALRVLRSSQSLMNRNQSIKNRWLRLEASIGNLPLAIRERRQMFKRKPHNWPNAMQLAVLLVRTEPTYEHVLDENGLPKYSSGRWFRLSPQQRTQMIQDESTQWLLESNKIVDAIQAQRGDILEIALLRASLLRVQGKITQGEKILTDFLQVHDQSQRTVEMYIAIGEYRIATDQLEGAVSILEEGKEYQSDEKREADTTLANFYYSKHAYKQATDLYVELIKAKPDRETSLKLVECYANQLMLEKASDLLDEIMQQDGDDLLTMMLAASIAGLEANQIYKTQGELAANSKYEQQRSILDEALILYPGDIRPYVQQARSYLNEYRRTGKGALLSDARLKLNEADEVRSHASATSYVRTEILLEMGDVQGAIGELKRLLKQTPDDVRARFNLVKLYENQREYSSALSVVNEALERNPILIAWHTKKGELHSKQGNFEEVALAYSEAFRLKPSSERLIRVTRVLLQVPKTQYAEIVAFFNSDGRKFLEGNIKIRSLLARALYGNGQRDQALEQLRLGYNDFTSSSADQQEDLNALDMWFIALNVVFAEDGPIAIEKFVNEVSNDVPSAYCLDLTARAWIRLGDEGLSRALELQQLAISKCPADHVYLKAILLINLGNYKIQSQDYEGADSAFVDALKYNPIQLAALNNTAYVKGEFLNKPTEALPFAQKAKAISPGAPNILDTLGWTYYLLNQYSLAEDELRESVKLRESAGNVYHLASVFFKQGRLDNAQVRLNRAAELDPDPQTKADISRLAADIAKARNR